MNACMKDYFFCFDMDKMNPSMIFFMMDDKQTCGEWWKYGIDDPQETNEWVKTHRG